MPCKLTENNFEPCIAMELAMNGNFWNSRRLGLRVVELTNVQTLEKRISGVSYRYSKKSKSSSGEIYLNYCPFCGTPIFQNIQKSEQDAGNA